MRTVPNCAKDNGSDPKQDADHVAGSEADDLAEASLPFAGYDPNVTFEIHDIAKIWEQAQAGAFTRAVCLGPALEEISNRAPEISFDKGVLSINLRLSLSYGRRFNFKQAEVYQQELMTSVHPDLRYRDGAVYRCWDESGKIDLSMIVQVPANLNFSLNYISDTVIESQAEFQDALELGLSIFCKYLDVYQRQFSIETPAEVIHIGPLSDEDALANGQRTAESDAYELREEFIEISEKGSLPGKPLNAPLIRELKKVIRGYEATRHKDHKNSERPRSGSPAPQRSGIPTALTQITFADILGQDSLVEALKDLTLQIKNPEAFTAWAAELPRGILFKGPPGTGKTLSAKALANECGIPFINVKVTDILSSYYAESEHALEEKFNAAEKAAGRSGRSILFFDEADSLFKKRTDEADGRGGGDRTDNRLLTIALTAINGFANAGKVIVILATNKPESLDEAILSRMNVKIEVPLPNALGLAAIMEGIFKKRGKVAGKNLVKKDCNFRALGEDLALAKASGRDVEYIVNAILAQKGKEYALDKSKTPEVAPISTEEVSAVIAKFKSGELRAADSPIGFVVGRP